MKILNAKQIKEVDAKTIAYEDIHSRSLMIRAQKAIFRFLKHNQLDTSKINIICGVGNNGGDGVALAIDLHNHSKNPKVFVIDYSKNYSTDFKYFLGLAIEQGVDINIVDSINQLPNFHNKEVIIDCIFGTGINREISGLAKEVVERINHSNAYVVSIDLPSGLMLDRVTNIAVEADETVVLEIPKLSLFLPSNYQYVGNLNIVNIYLNSRALQEAKTTQYYLDGCMVKSILKPISKFAHKGTQGHSLIIGGSVGKIGSVSLSSKAALKSGCGLVTAYVPKCGTIPLQSYLPEAMVIEDESHSYISDIKYDIKPSAIGIGVGMGQDIATSKAIINLMANTNIPMVIDADAINIISINKNALNLLQPGTILTPHPKELARLIGEWHDDFEKIEKTKEFAKRYNCIIIIKGAHTIIITPNELYVNSSGTNALATAGSGDVLTGIITSLLAQGYTALQASKIGVYLHGLTANICSRSINPRSFTASDIIDNIGNAYFELLRE